MAKHGKKLRKAYENIDRTALYSLAEAVKFVKQNAKAKFDETVDIAIRLNIDPRKAEQNIRGMVQLPSGTGKDVRVAVFAGEDKAAEAKKAGAELAGSEDLAEKIQKGEINFDLCIATPDMMPLVGRLGKILGPKGLMPNPKLGTVTNDVAKAVQAAKSGQVEYRTEKTGIIHVGIGKVSFSEDQILANIQSVTNAVLKGRPSGIKGAFVKSMALSSTMGASVKVKVAELGSA